MSEVVETVEFGEWCSAIKQQRARLLEKTGRARVYCLACNKQFVISVESDELLYCNVWHRHFHEIYIAKENPVLMVKDEIVGVPILKPKQGR